MTERYMLSITLSEKAYEEYRLVAAWKKIPVSTLIRQILEREHESLGFGELVKRATAEWHAIKDETSSGQSVGNGSYEV
ncbi:hypothetical protein [Nostoc parmelioides]|uniref:CopG family transcriptional regulator n=1 Tax=Nostoc parmelioides FACHB-3921 TaxID=2692909 RepID=A0ABR8BR96_9NOSO|nr:hypothetical protein [Nostoc parmelioides]MBD2255341.1 hypothetical protein [Nostoc parmelioides FACHB-3921]